MQTAFLIGPDTDAVRAQAFAEYGFKQTIGLIEPLMREKRFQAKIKRADQRE